MHRAAIRRAVMTGLLVLAGFGARAASAATVYMGPNEANRTLVQAFAAMRSGDTLIIRDGVYTGPDNVLSDNAAYGGGANHIPPSGVDGQYTKIQAEHDGQVTFDGQNARMVFWLDRSNFHHVEFRGIKWVNVNPSYGVSQVSIVGGTVHHLKFFRCGAKLQNPTGNVTTWMVAVGEYLLFEECYAWGAGRYGFLIQDLHGTGQARRVILRRCVVRLDDVNAGGMPVAGFMSYCAQEVEFQNCITLDADTSTFRNFSYALGGFALRRHDAGMGYARDVHLRGSIALHNLGWAHATYEAGWYFPGLMVTSEDAALPNTAEHMVLWDVMAGIAHTSASVGAPTITNVTVKTAAAPPGDPANPGAYGSYYWAPLVWSIKNSVLINSQSVAMQGFRSDYNAVSTTAVDFGPGTTPGVNDYTDDNHNEIDPLTGVPGNGIPGLKYIVRTEPDSNLDQTGEGGANRGATVLKRYGVSGTLWGEPGYKALTDENLWPFPYEAQIRTDLRTYSPATGPSGTRGFCASGQTLSNYIWGYLGNTVPPFGVTASPTADGIALSWDRPADVALPTLTGFRIYRVEAGQYALVGSVEGSTAFSTTITGLDPGVPHVFVATALDSEKGESGYSDSATVDVTAPNAVTLSMTDLTATQVSLGWTGVSPNTTGFEVWQSVNNAGFSRIATLGNVTGFDAPVNTANRYRFYVKALNGNVDPPLKSAASNAVATVLQITSVVPNVAPPAPVGTSITWTATSVFGAAPVQYKFERLNGAGAVVASRAYGATRTYTWTPGLNDTGSYTIRVSARNAGSTAPFDAQRDSDVYTVTGPEPLIVVSLTPNVLSPANAGTRVTWTATVAGGTGKGVLFKFFRLDSSGKAVAKRIYMRSNKFTWTPGAAAAGTYVIRVWVRNVGSKSAYDATLDSSAFVVTKPPA